MKKRIVLLNESGLNDIFTKSFINEGYDVISILQEPFIYKKGLWEKLMNIFYRIFFKDDGYLKRNYYTQLNKEVFRRLKKIKSPIDYTVIFRADYYSKKNIKFLRKKSKKLITYQYDGWKLGSSIVKYRNYFDRVFFFDKNDLPKYGNEALPLSNCYFIDNNTYTTTEFDIFYLGTGTPTRIQQIKNLYNRLSDKFKIKAIIKIPNYQEERKMGGVQFSHKGLQYFENMDFVKRSKCLVDIKFDYHNGLSFRFFEALYYRKKLITNNESIKEYDFYHPNNIFITDFENLEEIEEFIEKPYIEIDEKIVEKYSFTNWSRYLLDTPPYQEILLP